MLPASLLLYQAEGVWPMLPNTPAVKVNLDSAHISTMFALNAKNEGKMVVALPNHFLKGDTSATALYFDKNSELFKAGFNITTKNW
jgi:hypothetical protein